MNSELENCLFGTIRLGLADTERIVASHAVAPAIE